MQAGSDVAGSTDQPRRGAAVARRAHAAGAVPFLAGSALLGTIGIFVHEARADPLSATWFRCAFGLVGLTTWIVLRRQAGALRLTRANAASVLAAGILLVAGWALFFTAIERVSTGVAVVLFHVQPFWVLVLGAWWLNESVSRQRLVSTCVAMLGLAFATGLLERAWQPAQRSALAPGYWIGVAWCLIGAVCTACVTIIARRLRDMPAGSLAWWQCAIGAATLWYFPLANGWPPSGAAWLWLAGLGLIHTGLSYSLMYAGMARLRTERIAVLQFVYPAVAIVIDWLYFDQRLSAAQLTGIGLMAGAIWFAERAPGRERVQALRASSAA